MLSRRVGHRPAPHHGMTRVVIIGGGAIGSAIACFLGADPNFDGRITVLERDPTYARASSALSASSIRQQFSTPVNIQIGLYGIEFMRQARNWLAVDDTPVDIGLTEPGYLFLAGSQSESILRSNHTIQQREGALIELLDTGSLKLRFPWLRVDDLAVAAHGVRGEGWFDGYSLLQAYRRRAMASGARFLNAEVIGLRLRQKGAQRTIEAAELRSGEQIQADVFVNAAGPWARHIAHWAGISLPVAARRRTVHVFESPAQTPRCPLVIDPSGVYFRPEGRGYICGVSPPADNDPDDLPLDPEAGVFEDIIWPVLAHRVPGFESLRQTRAWAGYYEMNTFDANGIVGPHPDVANLLFANGFSGHGIQQSPAVGRGLAEWLIHGRYQTLDLSPLAFTRILEQRPLLEQNVV